jgi:hypothetical protein
MKLLSLVAALLIAGVGYKFLHKQPESQFGCHFAQYKYHSSWGMVSSLEHYAMKADMDRECR